MRAKCRKMLAQNYEGYRENPQTFTPLAQLDDYYINPYLPWG